MNLIENFKEKGVFMWMDIIYILWNIPINNQLSKITPSMYAKEMQISTQDRLSKLNKLNICNVCANICNCNKKSRNILGLTPKILIFQNFTAFSVNKVNITVINRSQALVFLRMIFEESSYFSIDPPLLKSPNLAPGMEMNFVVTFSAAVLQDYAHSVTFVAGSEKQVIPIIALGPRPLCSFPDSIIIKPTLVKVKNTTRIVVKNYSVKPTAFTLSTKSPFTVTPKSCNLCPDESVEITVSVKCLTTGRFSSLMEVRHDSGEVLHISLNTTVNTTDVDMDRSTIYFPDTYVGLSTQQTIYLRNKSNNRLSFTCAQYASQLIDMQWKQKMTEPEQNEMENKIVNEEPEGYKKQMQNNSKRKCTKICCCDELLSESFESNIVYDNIRPFIMYPLDGDLYPHSSAEINVIFSPDAIGEMSRKAYIDVEGVEDRIEVIVSGVSIAPSLKLNVETLNMSELYINNVYHYEVVVSNTGPIPGSLMFHSASSSFGSVICCEPISNCIEPNSIKIFVLSFSNKNMGQFLEEVIFWSTDHSDVFKLYLKGEIVYPNLIFDPHFLDFGKVPIGITSCLTLTIKNDCCVAVHGVMCVPDDGPDLCSTTIEQFSKAACPKPDLPQCPKQFTLSFTNLALEPNSSCELNIQFIPNLIKVHETCIAIEIDGVDNVPLKVPILYNSNVPTVIPKCVIDLGECVLLHGQRTTLVCEVKDFNGYFVLDEPQVECECQPSVEFQMECTEGHLYADSQWEIPITVLAHFLGQQEIDVRVKLFGALQSIRLCTFKCYGTPPDLTARPRSLNWGETKVLQPATKLLVVKNASPIDVPYTCSFAKTAPSIGRWSVGHSEGFFTAEMDTTLEVTTTQINAQPFHQKLLIHIRNCEDIVIKLSGVGEGCSITIGELKDHADLGYHFTHRKVSVDLPMTNHSTYLQVLEWTSDGGKQKNKNVDKSKQISIGPGELHALTLTAVSNIERVRSETWYLCGTVQGLVKKKLRLMDFPIKITFVIPKLEFSVEEINFTYDSAPYECRYLLSDHAIIKNVSKLPLNMELSTNSPFAFHYEEDGYATVLDQIEENCSECSCRCPHGSEVSETVDTYDRFQYVQHVSLKTVVDHSLFLIAIEQLKSSLNLKHSIKQYLEHEESMKVLVFFDPSNDESLHCKMFSDKIAISLLEHRNTFYINVNGSMNYPNIVLEPSFINFGAIPTGGTASITFKIINRTTLTVRYELYWTDFVVEDLIEDIAEVISRKYSLDSDALCGQCMAIKAISCLNCQTKESINCDVENTSDRISIDTDADDEQSLSDISNELQMKILNFEELGAPMEEKFLHDQSCHCFKTSVNNIVGLTVEPHLRVQIPDDIFRIAPSRGILMKGEELDINITCIPHRNTTFKATLSCDVLGGPSESLSIVGISSDMKFTLNTTKVDFNYCLYYKNVTGSVTLANTAHFPIKFTTKVTKISQVHKIRAAVREVTPVIDILKNYKDTTEIRMLVYPGILGEFKESILIGIEHLENPVTIELEGYGSFPQVYISLKKYNAIDMHNEQGYLAICNLTTEYLEKMREAFSDTFEKQNFTGEEECPEKVIPDSKQSKNKCIVENDWFSCSCNDNFPSVMHIEMAMERQILRQHLGESPSRLQSIFSSPKWDGPIPKFVVQPYELDYGVVVIGTQAICKAEVINYSPSTVRLINHKKQVLPNWLRVDFGGFIEPFSSSMMTVIFNPTNEDFKNLEENVATFFYVDVPFGASIPIMVKATCVVPYLHIATNTVHFGYVKCGDKTVCHFPIKNIGKVDILWYASVVCPKKSAQNVISLSNKYGILQPDTEDCISIEFVPATDATYSASMVLNVDKNPTASIISISGKGIVPKYQALCCSNKVKFPPTLPWSRPVHCYLGLTNPCNFTIEVVFPDFNIKNDDESAVYDVIKLFYNDKTELLVPRRFPGESLPTKLLEFFTKIMERPKDTKGRGRVVKSPTAAKEPPRTIEEEISYLQVKGDDPLKEIWNDQNESLQVDEVEENGIIILFHGSPGTGSDTMEMAYSVGKKLDLPVVNIDNALIDALLTMQTPAQNELKLIIENAYNSVSRKNKKKSGKKSKKKNLDAEMVSSEDEYDTLRMKIEVVLAKKIKGKHKIAGKRRTKMQTDEDIINTDANISMLPTDLTMRVLSSYLNQSNYKCGFIVDSMTSLLFKKPETMLIHVLQCRPRIKQIEIFLTHMSVNEWLREYEKKKDLSGPADVQIYQYLGKQSDTSSSDENFNNNDLEVYVLQSTTSKRQSKAGSNRSKSVSSSEKKGKMKVKDLHKAVMNNKFKEFENSLQTLLLIINNWSMEKCQVQYPLLTLWGSLLTKKGAESSLPKTNEENNNSSDDGISVQIWRYPFCTYKDCIIDSLTEKLACMKCACETAVTISKIKCEEYSVFKPLTFPEQTNKDDKFQWDFLDEPLLKRCICIEQSKHCVDAVDVNDYVKNILTSWVCSKCNKETPNTSSTHAILDTSSEIEHEMSSDSFYINEGEQSNSNVLDISNIMPLHKSRYPASHVLEPGDLLRCRLSFTPTHEGFFKQSYNVGIVGCPQSVGKVDVFATCDMPRLDCRPKKMFLKFVRQSVNTISYSQAFLDDRKVFQFGPVFIKSSIKQSTTFWMKNVSLMTAIVEYTLLYSTEVFTLDHDQHHIEPGERHPLRVYAAPQDVGSAHNTVLCSVKDNPKVFTINLDCVGVEPKVTLTANFIDFSKVLLHKRETKTIVLTNNSALPVMWKIPVDEQVAKRFVFSKSSGTLKEAKHCYIDIKYTACQVEVVKTTLNFKIYQSPGPGGAAGALQCLPLQVCGECYDVSVDCSFAGPDDTHLFFGPCKINVANTLSIFLLNRGKYDTHYRIKKLKNVKLGDFLKSVQIDNKIGVLPPSMKTIAINVTCTPTALVELQRAPAFTCTLVDGIDGETVVAQFPINITIQSYYNTFTIKPESELDFHAVKIGESMCREVIITNTTITPIKYEVMTAESYASRRLCMAAGPPTSAPGTAGSTARKSGSKKGKSPRTENEKSPKKLKEKSPKRLKEKSPRKLREKSPKNLKKKSPKKQKDKSPEKSVLLKCGNFKIENCIGILSPDTSRSITIRFSPEETEPYVEVVRVCVEGSDPARGEDAGVLRLVGQGAMPSLAVWEVERTFHSHFIVNDLNHHRPSAEGTPHCVFVQNSASLHFMCMLVNSSLSAAILLYNDGLIPAIVSLCVNLHSDSDAPALPVFIVSPESVCIDPSESKQVFVSFTPTALVIYKAILQIKIEGTSDVYTICLTGEGIIPRVEIIEPKVTQSETELEPQQRCLTFPPTFVDNVSTANIVLKNIGETLCAVLLCVEYKQDKDVADESNTCFGFASGNESSYNFQQNVTDKQESKLRVKMSPSSEKSISVIFKPTKRGKLECTIQVLIANNPYESVEIACDGTCFIEDVTIRGLPILPLPLPLPLPLYPLPHDSRRANNSATTLSGSRASRIKSESSQRSRSATAASSQSVRSATGKSKISRKQRKLNKKLSNDISTLEELISSPKYFMDLGGCELNVLKRRTLIIVNHSKTVYKFEWILPSECVVVQPGVGFLLPEEETDVTLTFHSNISIYLYKIPLICMLIQYASTDHKGNTSHSELKGSSWDETQTVTVYQYNANTNGSKTMLSESASAPLQDDTLPQVSSTTLQLEISFSVIADHCKYTCSLDKDIAFKDTLMFQTRYVEFTVHNVGAVPLKIEWKFVLDGNYPTRTQYKSGNIEMAQEEHVLGADEGSTGSQSVQESCETNTLFSMELCRSKADTWCEADFPFDVTPSQACIPDGTSQIFRVTFSPTEAFQYKCILESNVANLDPDYSNVYIGVEGRSLVPYCHMELEESDFLTSGRRDLRLPPAPHNSRVVEFDVLGIGCYKKVFNIVNPTTETYKFLWKKISMDNDDMPLHCNLMEGILKSGFTEEICFTFNPKTIGMNESHWIFNIPQYELEVNFLIVGIVRQPRVMFSPSILKLSPMLIDNWAVAKFDIVNEECEALHFKFNCKEVPFGTSNRILLLQPESGTLEPNSKTNISLKYKCLEVGTVSLKIGCNISYCETPMFLCVQSTWHSIRPLITYTFDSHMHVLQNQKVNDLRLGKIPINQTKIIQFLIRNEGSLNVCYNWEFVSDIVEKYMDISIDEEAGQVLPGQQKYCTLTITIKKSVIKNYPLSLHILQCGDYNIFLNSDVEKPKFTFSFTSYDFGKCVSEAPPNYYHVVLTVNNDDDKPITLNIKFDDLPELRVALPRDIQTISPNSSLTVPIFFQPTEEKNYHFKIPFTIEEFHHQNISIEGEGVGLHLDLVDGCQQTLDFGEVRVGEQSSATIKVMSRTKVPIKALFYYNCPTQSDECSMEVSLLSSDCLPLNLTGVDMGKGDTLLRGLKDLARYKKVKERTQKLHDADSTMLALHVTPCEYYIKPNQKVNLKLHFIPTTSIRHIHAQLCTKVFEVSKRLVLLEGQATSVDLRLDQNFIQFGVVHVNKSKMSKLVLTNNSHLKARYMWDENCLDPRFHIAPIQGDLEPQCTETFKVLFKSEREDLSVKCHALCRIIGHKDVQVQLYATCINPRVRNEKPLQFTCAARQLTTKTVKITNTSDCPWDVTPVIHGDGFETVNQLTLNPHSVYNLLITFKPIYMGLYQAQLFVSPLGENSMFYELKGKSEMPEPNCIVNVQVACRTRHVQVLPVYKLSQISEIYKVSSEIVKIVPDKFTGYFDMNGANFVNVVGDEVKYQWSVLCYVPCTMEVKTIFTNEANDTFQYCVIRVAVTPAEVQETVLLSAQVREYTKCCIAVKNPLLHNASFSVTCASTDIQYKTPFIVPPCSEETLEIMYTPLVVASTEVFLQLSNSELGMFVYKLCLQSLAASQQTLSFITSFGSSLLIQLPICNGTSEIAQFGCEATDINVVLDKSYKLGPKEKKKICCAYEPSKLGEQNGKITFTSQKAGEFVYNIVTHCTKSKPQGPIDIVIGGNSSIKFKNVFDISKTFKLSFNNEHFTVDNNYYEFTIEPKKTIDIFVCLSLEQNTKPPTGTLTVECNDVPEATWKYFLRGVPNSND